MTNPTPMDAETEAGLFLEITSIARRQAATLVGVEEGEDIAQDVVLECLIRLRAGSLSLDLTRLPGLVREMARGRAIDQLRRTELRAQPDEDFMRELTDSTHSWMEPGAAIDEEELEEFRERALASLDEKCRSAYLMVREEGRSYDEAASRLGISRATVNAHVVFAQRVFRMGLQQQEVPVPPAARGGRQARSRKRSGGARADTLPRPAIITWMLARSPPSGTLTLSRRTDADSAGQHVAVASQRGRIPRPARRQARGRDPDGSETASRRGDRRARLACL